MDIPDLLILKDILQDNIGKYIADNNIKYVQFCLRIDPSIKVEKYFLENNHIKMMELLFPYLTDEALEDIVRVICGARYRSKYVPIFKFIIERGVDFNRFKTSSIKYIFENDTDGMTKMLLEGGLRLNRFTQKDFENVKSHHMIKLLLENGANLDLTRALYKVCTSHGDFQSVKYLIEFNKTEGILNKALICYLTWAHIKVDTTIIKLLIENGANIETITDSDIDNHELSEYFSTFSNYWNYFVKSFINKDYKLYENKIYEYYTSGIETGTYLRNYNKIIKVLHGA